MTELEYKWEFELTKYLDLTGELWGVFCDDLGETDRVITAPHCTFYESQLHVTKLWFYFCFRFFKNLQLAIEPLRAIKKATMSTMSPFPRLPCQKSHIVIVGCLVLLLNVCFLKGERPTIMNQCPSTQLRQTPAEEMVTCAAPLGIKVQRPTRKYSVYIQRIGRTGNCLFEIAAGYALAKQYNHRLILDKDFKSVTSAFPSFSNMTFIEINDELNVTRIQEERFAKYYPNRFQQLANMGDILIKGYFQSFKYFSDCEDDIRRLFRFNNTLITYATQTLADIHTAYINKHGPVSSLTYVGLHIRMGDMMHYSEVHAGRRTADLEYINKSILYFQRKYKNVAFVLRTDSPKWSKKNLFMEAVYDPPAASAEQDLALLSLCNHTITTVGTFSWWAGWLAGGEVSYYHQPYILTTRLGWGFIPEDFFPSDWLPISLMSRQDIERYIDSTWLGGTEPFREYFLGTQFCYVIDINNSVCYCWWKIGTTYIYLYRKRVCYLYCHYSY